LVDRLQPRGAEAVHRHSGDLNRQARQQRRHPGDVAIVLARLVGGAHVDVVDPLGVEAVALDHGGDHPGGEVVGAHPREGAAKAAHRGSKGIDDHRLGHAHDCTLERGE
jgi:hypothetical protein